MNFLQATILGIVEGITEFLPISSTFHLIFTSKILGIQQTDFSKLFEVFIQAGAIFSVLLLYYKDIVKKIELSKKVALSFIPTALIGLILYKIIKNVFFESNYLMLVVFAAVGLIFLLIEWLVKKKNIQLQKDISRLTYREAILIGLIQALAVIPGVSRAGAVIVVMMFLRYKRDQAAYYSFLLSIPTIFAAAFYDLFKMRAMVIQYSGNITLLIIGIVSAFISSYFVVKWFIGYLQKNSLTVFAIYRLLLAIILILFVLR